jgi:hypothetical protein
MFKLLSNESVSNFLSSLAAIVTLIGVALLFPVIRTYISGVFFGSVEIVSYGLTTGLVLKNNHIGQVFIKDITSSTELNIIHQTVMISIDSHSIKTIDSTYKVFDTGTEDFLETPKIDKKQIADDIRKYTGRGSFAIVFYDLNHPQLNLLKNTAKNLWLLPATTTVNYEYNNKKKTFSIQTVGVIMCDKNKVIDC